MTPRDLYDLRCDPTFDQLKNAFTGHIQQEQDRIKAFRNISYGASRHNASRMAGILSKKAARAIGNEKFSWERGMQDTGPDFNLDDKVESFISKFEDGE